MKPAAFEYHAPESVEEAVGLLAELGDDAKVLAGGQSLVPMLSLRLAYFDHLVDISRLADLRAIGRQGETVGVGAATVDATVAADDRIAAAVPLLTRATPLIGHFQIRNRGTLGGSIAHADPSAEYPAVALTLDAEMEARSVRGTRRIPAAEYFLGFWTTSLETDELLTEVRFPVWGGRCGFGVREFARRYGDFAIAGAAVAVELDAHDRVVRCAIGLLGLGPTPLRAASAEGEALGATADVEPGELGHLAVGDMSEAPSDLHGSASYRRRVGAAMVARAWTAAIEEAQLR